MSDAERPRTGTKEWKWRRAEVIIRDEYECQNSECDKKGGPRGDATLHVHHVTPVSEGGTDDDENLTTLCSDCHHDTYDERAPNSGQFTEKYPLDRFTEALRELGGAASTTEVENKVGCSRRTALDKLNELADQGTIEREKIGTSFRWVLE